MNKLPSYLFGVLFLGSVSLFTTTLVQATEPAVGMFTDTATTKPVKVSVTGTVLDKKTHQPLPYVQVVVDGTTLGTTSDAAGNFSIKDIPLGSFRLIARQVGYASSTYQISSQEGSSQHIDIYMQEEAIELDGVVVTSSRSQTLRRVAPSLVTVLSPEMFSKTSSSTLSQGLRFQPGLRIEDNCQNCGFNQVRINGLEGAYSQILIDGRPIFSALAGVYGLEQIPANMIERVEVVRGGGSALYGSGAVGGVINIITREPARNSGEVSHQSILLTGKNKSSVQNVTSFNASVVTEDRRAALMVFGQHNYRPGHDYDGDDFTELPNLRNRSLGLRSYLKTGLYGKLSLEYHSMQEYRRGGDRLDMPPFQARIAEYLQHYINGGGLRFDQGFAEGRTQLSLYASAQHIQRRSYYGGGDTTDALIDLIIDPSSDDEGRKSAANDAKTALNSYGTTQDLTAQSGAMLVHRFGESDWYLTSGLENSINQLDDKSVYRPEPIDQKSIVWGQYDQVEFRTDKFSALAGGRFDLTYLYEKGKRKIDPLFIFSPRANLRYNPISDMAMRLSYSEGFRAPQFFDEEMHVELLGGQPISRVLSKDLKEERSRSISGSIDYYGHFGSWQYNVMIEGFATFISNKFEAGPTDTDANIVEVRNQTEGVSKVFGANLEARLAYSRLFDLQLGLTLQRSRYGMDHVVFEADSETGQQEVKTRNFDKTPNIYGYMVATLRPSHHSFVNLSATYTGPMDVKREAYEGVTAKEGKAIIDNKPVGDVAPDGSFDFIHEGQRYRGLAQGFGKLQRAKAFFDLDIQAGYVFDLTSSTEMELSIGVQNILNSYQEDSDMGPGRASTYVYGPMQPRRATLGLKLSF
ncbi:Colicin I receptor precursor [Porphyromonas crevioricanis]|uniref:Colicin I receptor n=1 Tax=Porphyromonas crevioricanis TaxID=393921 RepID=A0A2X4PFK7_9PORP|nr:TonB-dependent receptor [Porphyromonas crevioricanis]GAD07983.1 TonB-dependent receptor; outer membrane receptor for ferrienterochelin and colicins [Porphyromonas crevioricanis JCM 13913]SQH72604.1 Colicin I receptor precursor [Porphyromonas crevioricanis]